MSTDPLSDLLRSVRLRGAVFYYVTCRDDWVAASGSSRDLSALMPGAEHVVAYHLVVKGGAWAAIDGAPPARLGEGDIVVFPQGDAHLLSSAPGAKGPLAEDAAWRLATRDDPKPIPVSVRGGAVQPGATLPADEATDLLVCGFIACDLRPFNPLIAALPRMLHMSTQHVGAWVGPMLHAAVRESRERRSGSAAVLERASEMMFVDVARRYLESLPEDATGWLAALRDRFVGPAIALMHDQPAEPWTIDELGRRVGLSRSALHDRFAQLVGQTPMQYLTSWRMQCGARMLRECRSTVATIALEVGYDSEAAFSRAFKRFVGKPPAAWRREQGIAAG